MSVQVRQARAQDLSEIDRLLQDAELPRAGVTEHLHEFAVADDGGRIVGCAGLESYGPAALLRSVVVAPPYRGLGVARALVSRMLDRAAVAGADDIYLLTSSAVDYFRRFGFEQIARDHVASGVRVSEEFTDACCAAAQAMHLRLGAPRVAGGRAAHDVAG